MNVAETDIFNVSFQQENNDSLRPNNSVEVGVYISLEICIALFAFMDNLLVIIALWKFRSLRSPTNSFVASLAVADIAVAVFSLPSAILLRLGLSVKHSECEPVEGPSVGEEMCSVMALSVLFLTQVSIFSLLVIAIDRFIAISYPFRYNVFMTKNKTRMGIVAAWILAGLIAFLPEFGWSKWAKAETCDRNRCAFEDVISMEYMVYFNFFGCVLAPLLGLGVMYLIIFRSAKNQLRKIYFDVKHLKRNRRNTGSSDFLGSIKQAASVTMTELRNEHGNRKKILHQVKYLPSSSDDAKMTRKNDVPRHVSHNIDQYNTRNYSTDNSPEIKIDKTENPKNFEFKSPAQTTEKEFISDSFKSAAKSPAKNTEEEFNSDSLKSPVKSPAKNAEEEFISDPFKSPAKNTEKDFISVSFKSLTTHYDNEIGEESILHSEDVGNHHTVPRRGVRELTLKAMHFRRQFKVRSVSYEADSTDNPHVDGQNEDHQHDLRPNGKAHSFSASSTVKMPFRIKAQQAVYHVNAAPINQLGESSSLNSSRSTVYASQHGVWSTVDGSTYEQQRKMKRKRQLLKKEFRAARSLATVVGVFALCWLPLHIMNTVTLFYPTCTQPPWLKDLAILLSHANSLINPLIYAYRMRDFRIAFRKILAPFFSTVGQKDSRLPSRNLGALKLCCVMTSRSDVINDVSSDDISASGYSWKEKQTHQTTVGGNKSINYNKNNNNSKSQYSRTQGPRKSSWPRSNEKTPNQGCATSGTEVTFISPQSAKELLHGHSCSLSDSNDSSRASSSDQISMNMSFLDGAADALSNSPETTL